MTIHSYDRDLQSGAGNCFCGRAREHRMHPHAFTPWWRDERLCTCGLSITSDQHLEPEEALPW